MTLRIECSEPERARGLLAGTTFAADIDVVAGGLVLNLPAGTTRELIAEVARLLVEGAISLYGLRKCKPRSNRGSCR